MGISSCGILSFLTTPSLPVAPFRPDPVPGKGLAEWTFPAKTQKSGHQRSLMRIVCSERDEQVA
jgi:hypothetical protein